LYRFLTDGLSSYFLLCQVHYAKFTTWVLSRQFFFDVHPVFGKWIIAMISSSLGFDPTLDKYSDTGSTFSTAWQAMAARAPAAVFGSLNVPVFYWLCRRLHMGQPAALLGGCFILFDLMHVIQSRLVMVDSVLAFFTCAGLLSALLLWDARKTLFLKGQAAEKRDFGMVAALLVATGVLCGLAVSVRWTAFATPSLVLVVSMFGIPPFCAAPLGLGEVVVLAFTMFSAYYGSFWIFLRSLSRSGSGDAFMSEKFQACLEGSEAALAAAAQGSGCTMSIWARFVELNQKIFQYSKGIRGSDRWGSSWFQWILNWRGALYYRDVLDNNVDAGTSREALIYVLMNPAMVVMVNTGMALFVGILFYLVRYRTKLQVDPAIVRRLQRGSVLLFGWMGSMLPTMVVYRSGPLYQYLPGLFFAQALGALSFDMICPQALQNVAVGAACVMLIASFAYWSPWVYGTPLTVAKHAAMRWMPAWD
jgi:dolichyl-phosphate-mannose--protein O-mannosyl transferase